MDSDRTVRLSGACDIARIRELHQAVVSAFDLPVIEVDLEKVTGADTAFVQLLVCASTTASRRGRSFNIRRVPAAVATALSRAGFSVSSESGHITVGS